MAEQIFYTEDICGLRAVPGQLGVIDRTTSDVDSHAPHPERDYDRLVSHQDISKEEFRKFKKTGIPPVGTVVVVWHGRNVELIPTKYLKLLDRALLVGDVVKKETQDAMSGTVVQTDVVCSLIQGSFKEPIASQTSGEIITNVVNDYLGEIPAEELRPSNDYVEGSLIIYRDWVGRIEDIMDDVSVRLSNGSVVEVYNPDELETLVREQDRLEVGDVVKTAKGNLRRGKWVYGEYDATIPPVGDVVKVHTIQVVVSWICRRMNSSEGLDERAVLQPEPPAHLGVDELESGEVHVYDRSRSPAHARGSYGRCVEFLSGAHVRFKDLSGAAMKYDGTKSLNYEPSHKNHLHRMSRTETLGFDLNVFIIGSLKTMATVMWQDCTVTSEDSINLVPDLNLEDESEVWPGEIVISNEKTPVPDNDWIDQPKKVGVVQSVSAADRLAKVLWLPRASVQYHNLQDTDYAPPVLLPGSSLGLTRRPHDDPTRLNDIPNAVIENVTLYDIRAADGLNKRRGDFVILHPPAGGADINLLGKDIDWFGEVIDLGKDGFLTVRLGALEKVRDIRISPEFATIVHSSDMPNDFDVGGSDSDSNEEYETDYEDSDDVPWITPNGEPVSDEDEDVWSTEESNASDEEDAMPDLLEDPDTVMTDTANLHEKGSGDSQENSNPPSLPFAAAEEPAALDIQLTQSPVHTRTSEGPLSSFAILDTSPPDSNPYLTSAAPALTSQRMKRVRREHNILASSLPEGIFVRTWESRLDLLRVMIIGPLDTPYEFAPFLIDMRIPPEYPQSPPEAYFHSWTEGKGPVNPNLYENGKICLSLLGTWHADEKGENWSPTRSTILQMLVSIMGLVLVKEPYFNEAGFEVRAGMADAKIPSQLYSERTYFRTRGFITHACRNHVHGFEDLIRWLYLDRGDQAPKLLDKAISAAQELIDATAVGDGSASSRGGLAKISKGAVVMLRREMVALEELRILNA